MDFDLLDFPGKMKKKKKTHNITKQNRQAYIRILKDKKSKERDKDER